MVALDVQRLMPKRYSLRLFIAYPDEPCGFTRVLKSRREEEHSQFDMECTLEREEANVTW